MRRRSSAIQMARVLVLAASAVACQGEDGGRLAAALDPVVAELFSVELAPGMAVVAVQGDLGTVFTRSDG